MQLPASQGSTQAARLASRQSRGIRSTLTGLQVLECCSAAIRLPPCQHVVRACKQPETHRVSHLCCVRCRARTNLRTCWASSRSAQHQPARWRSRAASAKGTAGDRAATNARRGCPAVPGAALHWHSKSGANHEIALRTQQIEPSTLPETVRRLNCWSQSTTTHVHMQRQMLISLLEVPHL